MTTLEEHVAQSLEKAREAVKRVEEARTPEEVMMKAVVQQAIGERLARCELGEPTKKGRQPFILHGEPGPAERKMMDLQK